MAADYREELILDTRAALTAARRLEQTIRQGLGAIDVDIDPRAATKLASELREVTGDSARIKGNLDAIERSMSTGAVAAGRLATDTEKTAVAATRTARESSTIDDRLKEAEQSAARLFVEINKAELAAGRSKVDFQGVASALDISEDEARKLAREILEAQSNSNKLEGAARDIARQMGLSGDEARRFADQLARADRESGQINRLGGVVGTLRSGFAGLAAVVGGLSFAGVVRGLLATVSAASDLAESQSKAAVVFGRTIGTVQSALGDTATTVLLSQQAALEATATFGNLFTALGLTQAEAATLSPAIVQLAADLASFNNASVEDVIVSLRAGLVGEVEPLRRLGVSINAATVEAKAMALGLTDATGTVTEAGKVQARYALILEQTRNAQGDVARTADGLANTQRAAQASAKDLAAEIGQQLEPAMQALYAIIPPLLEGIRQLIPGFAAAGDSAAEFFNGVNEGGGFRTFFATAAGATGLVTDAFQSVGDVGSAVFSALTLDFKGAGDQFDQMSERFARGESRIASVFLAKELDAGADAVTSFGNALAHVARESENIETFTASYRGLAIQAGLTKPELAAATKFLIENADTAKLSAAEVEALKVQLRELNLEIANIQGRQPGRFVAIGDTVTASEAFVESLEKASTASRDFEADLATLADAGLTNLVARLREGGPELAAVADELAANLVLAGTADDFLGPALDIPARLDQLAEEASASRDRVREAINPFEGAAEVIQISKEEFMRNVRQQIEQAAELEAGTALLESLGFDKLAEQLRQQGPGAVGVMRKFVKDLTSAAAIEGDLEDLATDGVDAYADQLFTSLQGIRVDPAVARAIAATIDNPAVRTAFERATGIVGGILQPALDASFADLEAPDLGEFIETAFSQPEAANAGAAKTFTEYERGIKSRAAALAFNIKGDLADGIAAAFASDDALNAAGAAGGEVADRFEKGVRGGLEMTSPSKVMQRLARQALGDFFTAARSAASETLKLSFDVSATGVAGARGGGGPSFTGPLVALTVNGSGSGDVSRDAAKGAQVAGSIVSMLPLVRGPGTIVRT